MKTAEQHYADRPPFAGYEDQIHFIRQIQADALRHAAQHCDRPDALYNLANQLDPLPKGGDAQ